MFAIQYLRLTLVVLLEVFVINLNTALMSFFKKSTQAVILGGIFLVIPVVLIIIVIKHALQLVRPVGKDVMATLNIHSVFGVATLTIVSLIIITLFCYVAGLLIQVGLVKQWSKKMEQHLFLIVPSLQVLKYRLIDENTTPAGTVWKAIMIRDGDFFLLGFITDEGDDKFMSVLIPDAPNMGGGEIRFIEKATSEYYPISMKSAMNTLNTFGAVGRPWEVIKPLTENSKTE